MEFRLAAVSSNRNSFGLFQFVFVDRSGFAVKALGGDLKRDEMPLGTSIYLATGYCLADLSSLGFECPDFHDRCSPRLLAEIWGEETPEGSVPWA